MPETTFGVFTSVQVAVARVDALGAVAEVEVGAGDQAGALLEDRRDQLLGGARVGGRLEDDGGAGPQVPGQRPGRLPRCRTGPGRPRAAGWAR